MIHVPPHAPWAAAEAVVAGAVKPPGGRLALVLTGLLAAASGFLAVGATTPTGPPLSPVAAVSAMSAEPRVAPVESLSLPHDPMSWRSWPSETGTTLQMQPIPAFVGVDDPPSDGPPPAVDPAVAALLAQLRDEAPGTPGELRPGRVAVEALDFALAQVGRPYVWGATGPASYDCSGLTWRSYAEAGVTLPRVSADQHARGGVPVAIADLLPGDLVFFATAAWDPGAVHHVGMYVGRGLMVDAPRPGAYVRVEPVTPVGYVGAVRVVPARPARTATPTPEPTPTPTDTPTPTATPSTTATATPTAEPTTLPTGLPTGTGPASPDPTLTPLDLRVLVTRVVRTP